MKTQYDPNAKTWRNKTGLRLPRHDLFFGTPENRPTAGIPIGDGDTGSLLWLEKDGLRIHVNKCDLWQDAPPGVTYNDVCYCSGHEEELTCVKNGGEIALKLNSPAFEYLYQKAFTARLSLADAAATLESETPFGSVRARAYAENGVTVLRCEIGSEEGEAPELRLSRWGSRTLWRWYAMQKPAPETSLDGTESFADARTLYITQALDPTKFCIALRVASDPPGEAFCPNRHTACMRFSSEKTRGITLYWTVKTADTVREAAQKCLAALDEAEARGEEALFRAHKKAWAAFWERSYLAVDDDYLENIWYLYLYYMNSESRGKYPPHFTVGLWGFYRDYIPWNYYFHYNEQHMYLPLDAVGHGELAECYYALRRNGMEKNRLYARIVKGKQGIFLHDVTDRYGRGAEYHYMNCSPGAQVAVHMWRHWRFTGDEAFLRETALPFMRESVLFYLDLLQKEADGLYHLHGTSAYESNEVADDVLTDFTMIRTLFPLYLPFAEEDLRAKMEDALSHLPAPIRVPMRIPEDWDGKTLSYGVGRGKTPLGDAKVLAFGYKNGVPVRKSFGDPARGSDLEAFPDVELSPLYPAGLAGLKDAGTELWETLRNQLWLHRTGEQSGHWNMLPIFLARMGMRGEVGKAARAMLSNFQGFPNGFNAEEGEGGTLVRDDPAFYTFDNVATREKCRVRSDDFTHFDFETEPIVAMALTESLLQSHEGLLRLCPAADAFPVAFRLFAEGGFAVGAECTSEGFVVTVESLRGEACFISLPAFCETAPLYAYIASAHGPFYAAEIKKTVLGRETVYDFSSLAAGETLLLSSVPIGELVCETPEPEQPNARMKTCGKAVLGSPPLMRPEIL